MPGIPTKILARIGLLLLAIGLGLLLAFSARAQTVVPVSDCCSQLIDYKHRYEATRAILDSTRAVDGRIMQSSDARIKAIVSKGNDSIYVLRSRNRALAADLDYQMQQTHKQAVRAEAVEKELKKWKPRTKAGIFFRKVRNGLAIVGGVAVLVVIPRFAGL